MKNLRILFIMMAVSAVVVATARPRDGQQQRPDPPKREAEASKKESETAKSERTAERSKPSKPAETTRSSSQNAYTRPPSTSNDGGAGRERGTGGRGAYGGWGGGSAPERTHDRTPSYDPGSTGNAYTRPTSPSTGSTYTPPPAPKPGNSGNAYTRPSSPSTGSTYTPPSTPKPGNPDNAYTRPSSPSPGTGGTTYAPPSTPKPGNPDNAYTRPSSPSPGTGGNTYTPPSTPKPGNSDNAYTRPSSPNPGASQPDTGGRDSRGDQSRDGMLWYKPQSPAEGDRGRARDGSTLPGNPAPKPGDWDRGDRDRDRNQGDWDRGDRDRDRDQGDWNRGDRDRNHGDWNRGDRDRNQGDWNRGDRDRDRDQGDRNRGDRDRDHNRGDRDRGDGGWNRLPDWDRNRDWDRDRRGDHRGPDRDYRPHDRYDRVRDRDGWWQHHRYADKTYKRDSRRPSPFWRIDWGYPYYGRYYNTWYYVPRINVVWRSDARPPLLGSAIVAYDDTFLGIISRDWQDDDSISNPYGRFGCPESPWSIWNMDGYWGSEYNFDSPWNPYATRPPRVYSGNYLLGYLTNNPDLYPRIDPYWLMDYLDVWVMD